MTRTIIDDDQIERASVADYGVIKKSTDTSDVAVTDDDARIDKLEQLIDAIQFPFATNETANLILITDNFGKIRLAVPLIAAGDWLTDNDGNLLVSAYI
jgi:hypothetical protein